MEADVFVEWSEDVDDPQLRCDLMNLGPGQFTYHGPAKFSFVPTGMKMSIDEFREQANVIYNRYKNDPVV